MTTTENNQTTLESRLKETTEENELLLCQLHQVQEELERYYLRNKELEQAQPTALTNSAALTTCWADDELPDVLAENQHLRAVVDVLRKVNQLEAQNALNVKLGNILIEGVDSPRSLLSVPGKLGKIWRESSRQTPPETLGGKDFSKVTAVFQEGGFDAVEKLLSGISVSPAMQANAYTVLARQLREDDQTAAVDAARLAYALDPKPYRLKWLAFRLHEVGQLVEAEAMLDTLPADIEFSDSEVRQVSRLRNEAKQARLREAKQKTGFAQRRAEVEKQLNALSRARDEQSRLATERAKAVDLLKEAKTHLEQDKKSLASQLEDQKRLVQERSHALETSKQAQVRLEQEKADVSAALNVTQKEKEEQQAELSLLIDQLHKVQEELERFYLSDQEKKLEITALTARYEEQAKIAAERNQAVETLQQAKALLEQEKAALTGRLDEQAKLATEHGQALEALKQSKAQLEQEKAALTGRHDEQAKLAAERGQALEALKQANAQLEQEKAALTGRHDEQAKLAAERQKQLGELKQQIQQRQSTDAELSSRQQLMQEELVRAESQLELIKDLLLREPSI